MLNDGRRIHQFLEHAIGSHLQRPLSDAARSAVLIDACRQAADAPDLRSLTALAQPTS